MDILLLRTAIAVDESPALSTPPAEGHRFLSAEGRQVVRALGNKLRLLESSPDAPSFDRFVTSPAPACVQTAELFADRVDYVGVIEVLPQLAGNALPEAAAPALLARGSSIVVVGDEPFLSSLGAFLVGRTTFPPLLHGQVSAIRNRQPAWCLRPGESVKSLLLIA